MGKQPQRMSKELEKEFAEVREYENYSCYEDMIDELKEKVAKELKKARQAELKKLRKTFDNCNKFYAKRGVNLSTYSNGVFDEMLKIVDNSILGIK